MYNVLSSLFFTCLLLIFVGLLVKTNEDTRHQNVYYNTGKIVAVGQCKSDGECSFQYLDNKGEVKYATSSKPVVLDQLVYQECWYENVKGNQCYVDYQPSKN